MFEKLLSRREPRHGELKHSELKRRQDETHPLARLRRDFDDLWERFLEEDRGGELGLGGDTSMLGGHVEWDDKEDEYIVRAEMPGFEVGDIDVKVTGNVLTLQAQHREEGEENGGYRRYGSFYESFTLPQNIREENIDACYHNGVLELHLPKSETSQAKRIAVKSV